MVNLRTICQANRNSTNYILSQPRVHLQNGQRVLQKSKVHVSNALFIISVFINDVTRRPWRLGNRSRSSPYSLSSIRRRWRLRHVTIRSHEMIPTRHPRRRRHHYPQIPPAPAPPIRIRTTRSTTIMTVITTTSAPTATRTPRPQTPLAPPTHAPHPPLIPPFPRRMSNIVIIALFQMQIDFLDDEFSLLVLLTGFVGLDVGPADAVIAAFAEDVGD